MTTDPPVSPSQASMTELIETAPTREIVVRPRTVLLALATILAVLVVLWTVMLSWRVVSWMVIAAFLAVALNPAVDRLERLGLRRAMAVTAVCGAALVVFGLLAWAVVPALVQQTTDLVQALPDLVHRLTSGDGPLGDLERRYHLVERVREAVAGKDGAGVIGLSSPALGVVRGVLTGIAGTITVFFLTAFMLLEGRRWIQATLDLVPGRSRPRWERAVAGIGRTVGGYVTGNLLISLIAGVAAFAILIGTGVPYALPLAVMVAILDLVPLVGATAGMVLAAAFAFGKEGTVACIIVVGALIAYQQIENHLLQPVIYGRRVPLSPLAVLVAVLIGAELAGIIGALIAIPVGGSIQVVLGEVLAARRDRILGVPAGETPPPEDHPRLITLGTSRDAPPGG